MKRITFGLFAIFLGLFAQSQMLGLPGPVTHSAIQNGNWNQGTTWSTGTVPGNGAVVEIPQGIRVRLTSIESARIKYLNVLGEFRIAIHDDARLLVETIVVRPSGFFVLGNPNNRMKPDKVAEIVFINDGQAIDQTWDPTEASRGLMSMGKIRLYGDTVTHMSIVDASMGVNQRVLDLRVPVPATWEVGDEIVLAGTHFLRDTDHQDELFRIDAINGTQITLDRPTQFPHLRVRTDMMLHVAHLTRNVIFRSESDSIPLRGHAMLMNGDVVIEHCAFIDMGRTDKAKPLDEVIVDNNTGAITPGPFTNRRGRYALHFHKNGIFPGQTPPSKVIGCVVRGTPGWGFVNHSSHVDFRENVCHDFLGAAFVTELGDELGNFFDNIAIHGVGEPHPGTSNALYDNKYKPIRIVFNNPYRPQPLGDFAFSGDGFWFQGSAVRARNNVANSCNGSGMIWFSTGAVDIADDNYAGFPRSAVAGAYAGYPNLSALQARNWTYSPDSLVISDLPILECDGLDAYACLVGFRLRFCNFSNNAFYVEASKPWDYTLEIATLPGKGNNSQADRLRQTVSNLNLWNNEQGFRMRYNEKTDFVNVKNFNRLDYHVRKNYSGAEFFHQSDDITFTDLLISGYAVAGWLISNTEDNTNEISFTNKIYASFSNADTKKTQVPCSEVFGMNVTNLTANSATLNWNAHPDATRFLVRYKVPTEQKWRMPNVTGLGTTSINVTGLRPGANYVYQINAGCAENVSLWSWPAYFTTPTSKKEDVLGELEGSESFGLWPNPAAPGATVNLHVPAGAELRALEVYDGTGKMVTRIPGNVAAFMLPESLATGMYQVILLTERGRERLGLSVGQ